MKRLLTVGFILGMLTVQARATTSYSFIAGDLADATGTLAPQTSIALMVLDTLGNGFTPPTAGSPLLEGASWGDDLIVSLQDLSNAAQDGIWYGAAIISYTGDISAGDQFRLYWFPTVTLAAATLTGGEQFGLYGPDLVGLDGSDSPWVLSGDGGGYYALYFVTQSQGGSNPNTAGWATDAAAIPEPSTMALAALGLLAAAVVCNRRGLRIQANRRS